MRWPFTGRKETIKMDPEEVRVPETDMQPMRNDTDVPLMIGRIVFAPKGRQGDVQPIDMTPGGMGAALASMGKIVPTAPIGVIGTAEVPRTPDRPTPEFVGYQCP